MNLLPIERLIRVAITQRLEAMKQELTGKQLTLFNKLAPNGLDNISDDELKSLYNLTYRTLMQASGTEVINHDNA